MIQNNVFVKSSDSTAKVSHNIMYLPMNQEIRTLVKIHNKLINKELAICGTFRCKVRANQHIDMQIKQCFD